MQQYDSFNIKLTYFKVCLAYIALVPILPDYFSIFGIDSRNFNALLLILLAIIYKRKIILNKRASIYFIGAVIFWSLEQIFIYTYSGLYVEGIYIFCRCVVAPMLIAIEIKNANRFKETLNVIVYTGGVVSFFGIIEAVTHFNIFSLLNNTGATLNYNSYRFGLLRIISSHNHTNTYCLYLMFLLSITFYCIQITGKGKKLLSYKIIYWLLWINVILTLSRSIILVTLALQLVLLHFSGFKSLIRKMVLIVFILIVVLVFIDFVFPELGTKISEIYYMFLGVFDSRYNYMYATSMGEKQADAIGQRLVLYEWVGNSMGNNWILGNGMNSKFNFEYRNTDGFYTWYSYKQSIEVQFLNLLYHGGIVTLVSECMLYLGCILLSAKKMFKKLIWEKNISFSLVCFLTFLAYFISFFSMSRSSEWKLFCILVALAYAYQSKLRYE